MSTFPQLTEFTEHRIVPDIDLEGWIVPGLTGAFFRRPEGDRIASVGLYRYDGVELFMAWGYVGEEHCRWTAYQRDGDWTPPHSGCPRVRQVTGGLQLDLGHERLTLPTAARVPATRPGTDASPGSGGSGCAGSPPPVARDLSHTTDSGSFSRAERARRHNQAVPVRQSRSTA